MSRRQALGALSTNNLLSNTNNINPNQINKQTFTKQATKVYGNENSELAYSSSQPSSQLAPIASQSTIAKSALKVSEFDFEIFQEEVVVDNKKCEKESGAKSRREEEEWLASFNKENEKCFHEEEDNVEDDDEEYNEENYEDDNDEEEEEEEDDEEEEEEEDLPEGFDDNEQEEEGISRLNMAAITDTLSGDELKQDTSMAIMMDSTSPMILDDTIKFQSRLSISGHDVDVEEEEEEEQEVDVAVECDEEVKRQQMLLDQENLLMSCMEYKDDILAYMREAELRNRPKPTYMGKQQDINSSMRSILVDWLVEVCEEYRLHDETLYNAVNYTDRFLSNMSVLRGKLQLVGTASMYIASKYEEIAPPDVSEFVYITDDTYTKKQVLRMEHLMLKVLDFKMTTPTINVFLTHYLRFGRRFFGNEKSSRAIDCIAKYAAELTLIDAETFLTFLPSQIAASAVYLALTCLGKTWTKPIADMLGYSHDLNELKVCIVAMHKTMEKASSAPQQAIYEKYKQEKYEHVALIALPRLTLSVPVEIIS